MSFALEVKEEIVSKEFSKELAIPFFVGLIKYGANLDLKNSSFKISTINKNIADNFYLLFSMYTNFTIKLSVLSYSGRRKYPIYELIFKNDIEKFFVQNKIYDFNKDKQIVPYKFIGKQKVKEKLIRAYFASVFVACGSVNSPITTNYHLEMQFSDYESAIYLQKLINSYKFEFKYISRKNKHVIYLKKNSMIFDFLIFISANTIAYSYFNEIVCRDLENSKNRLYNIQNSNIRKINEAWQKDVDNIEKIKNNGYFQQLSKKSQKLCEIRISYKNKSLQELSKIMNENGYKITKSGINTIFREIAIKANND